MIFYYNLDNIKEKNHDIEVIQKLESVGINTSNIIYVEKEDYLYIRKGYHFDIQKLVKVLNLKQYYFRVVYLDDDVFDEIKRNKKDYYSYYFDYITPNNFFYNQIPEKEYYIDGITLKVKNDIINYIDYERSYDYYRNGISPYSRFNITYNVYDTNSLNICFSGLKDKYIEINSDNYTKITEDKCINVSSKNGIINLRINNNYNRVYEIEE